MATHLPASTELLGMFVEALQAGRYASGAKACVLRDRTSRRCFAGGVRTRHWCCRLTGLLQFLRTEQLVDDAGADLITRSVGMFIPFAAMMVRWDAVRESAEATVRAHLRIAAIELATKLQLLTHAGFDFALGGGPSPAPPWLDPTTRHVPLEELRSLAGSPPLREVARDTSFGEHAVGRWFSKGERPSREALQVLAKYFAKKLQREWLPVYRDLYWHYALADIARRVERWLCTEDAAAIARVCVSVARCKGQHVENRSPRVALIVAATIAPPTFVVDHAIAHGAASDWADDASAVRADFTRAGIEQIENAAAQLDLVLARLPRRKVPRRPAGSSAAT